jgi:hypothetical protein
MKLFQNLGFCIDLVCRYKSTAQHIRNEESGREFAAALHVVELRHARPDGICDRYGAKSQIGGQVTVSFL